MKISKLLIAVAVVSAPILLTAPSSFAADSYSLDKPHTQIKFSVNRGGWTRVAGWFEKFDGSFVFDEADVSKSNVQATINTASINTGFAKRDAHLKSPDFFNAKEFPTMTFKSTKVEKTGAKTGKITGMLTLLGVTKLVTLDVIFNQKKAHPRIKKTFTGFTAVGKLNRSDYGMKFIIPAVSDEVQIEIQALAVAK